MRRREISKRGIVGIAATIAFLALLVFPALGGTTLLDEDFNSPDFANGEQNPAYPGWTWVSNPRSRNNRNSSDVPGAYTNGVYSNQVVQLEYTDDYGTYDVSLSWSNSHTYVLKLNASPSSWWTYDIDRYINPSILQQDDTVLWSATNLMEKYNSLGRNPWTSGCTFEYVIFASNFTAGAEGEPLRVKVKQAPGNRGIYIDNVSLVLTNLADDTTAPNPDPMTWAVEPAEENFTNNTMTATIAVDAPTGVEYYFENTNTGSNSGWQSGVEGHTWTDVNLPPGSTNSYRVKARDRSTNWNETGWSLIVAVTNSPSDTTAPTPDPMTWSTNPVIVDARSVYMVAAEASDPYLGVEYLFTNTTTGASSGWQSSRIWYQVHPGYETSFDYRVKARDLSPNANTTAWSAVQSVTIPTPDPAGLLVSSSFQYPLYPDGRDLSQGVFFVGWSWDAGSGDVHIQAPTADGVPGAATNRVIQFEQTSAEGIYDTDHLWAADDVYELTLNASPQAWSGSNQRYIEPSLRETDNTLLWSTNVPIPLYDASFAGTNPWPAVLTFEYTINASDFVGGTEGNELRLMIDHTGSRGIFIDNIQLVNVLPPAGTIFLFH